MRNNINFATHHLLIVTISTLCILIMSACAPQIASNTSTKVPELVFPTTIPSPVPQVVTATSANPAPPTVLSPTNTALPAAVNTATSVAPTLPAPTLAPAATAIVPNPVRINFATGATTGIVENIIQPGQVQNYLVGAAQTQPLIVSTDSLNHDVTFAVIGLLNGKTLLNQADKKSSWQTLLTVSQDYLIQVHGGASKEKYSLNVSTPARVNFDPGAISATRKGSTPGGYNVAYVLRASANQQMDLSLIASPGTAVLSVYGYQDGNPYLRYVVEQTTFSLKLPSTQDYIIQVVPQAGVVTDYSITFTIK